MYIKGEVYVDEQGFYCLGDGSFYDPDGFFFEKDGYDKYQGYYDDNGNYVPGEGYEDEYYGNYENLEDEDEEAADINEYLFYDSEDEDANVLD